MPSSKSAGHRALIMAFIARAECTIEGIDFSDDLTATVNGLKAMGAQMEQRGSSIVFHAERTPVERIEFSAGDSGSTLRFLLPLASFLCPQVRIYGSKRLLERPLGDYEDLWNQQGVRYRKESGYIELTTSMKAEEFQIGGDVSSQFLTGLLFLLAEARRGGVSILRSLASEDYTRMTVQVMRAFGFDVKCEEKRFTVQDRRIRPERYAVERDFSQMAFFAVLAALRGRISFPGMNPDCAQGDRRILEILSRIGAGISVEDGVVSVFHSALQPIEIDLEPCIDLGPILMTLACFLSGRTRLYHTARLKLKESDRAAAMQKELSKAGAEIFCAEDEILIDGRARYAGTYHFDCHNDHRIAMALAVFAAANQGTCVLHGSECVAKSYPDFFKDFFSLKGGNDD